ncbi:MAG: cytochrome c-type biogenesis protein CcmH [Dehalococcoidales bacterium]
MGLKGKLGIILLIIIALFSPFPARANGATVSDISKQLICQCGCTMVLLNCSHAECASREAMTTLIEQKLAQGQSGEGIIQFFVAQYGEQVLASPPKRGFNLMAWVTPFAALLFGGGVIYFVLKKWVRRETPSPTDATAETDEEDEQYQRQLEEELKEFTPRSFR